MTWLLPRIIGPTNAAAVLYGAQRFSGADDDAMRLVNELSSEPLRAAEALAARLVQQSRMSLRQTKQLLNVSMGVDGLRAHLNAELRAQVMGLLSADFKEGRAAREAPCTALHEPLTILDQGAYVVTERHGPAHVEIVGEDEAAESGFLKKGT